MEGSPIVQSARISTMPRSVSRFSTSGRFKATRLLTWQVMHQEAVKSTKTGLPDASRPSSSACEKLFHFKLAWLAPTSALTEATDASTAEREASQQSQAAQTRTRAAT